MKHHAPNDFVAAPQRGPGRHTESELIRTLQLRFQPQERARSDAQRVDDEPMAIAAGFGAEVDGSRAEHYAVVRTEAMSAVVSNIDAVGAMVVTVELGEIDQTVRHAEARLAGVDTERRRLAAAAIETWRRGRAAYQAWADRSGAQLHPSPWPGLAYTLMVIVCAALAETWTSAQLLAGPPVVGVPSPLVLGLLFSGGSLIIGALAATGHMLAADGRRRLRRGGFALLVLALVGWVFLCLMGAHMRLSIELGGGGTVSEILASMDRGFFEPLVSPMALLLAGASAATTAVVWLKGVSYFGLPFGHRAKDAERAWCFDQLDNAEERHKAEIKAVVLGATTVLDNLEEAAWEPANDAMRLEREVHLIVAQARESERAIDRAHRTQLTVYSNTFRRVRPGVDLTVALALDSLPNEALSDPVALHEVVSALSRAASGVSNAVAEGKIRLRQTEVSHLAGIDALYSETRRSGPGRGLTF